MCDQPNETIFYGGDLFRHRTIHLSQRRTGLGVRLSFNELADRFGLNQVHLAVRDGSQCELAGDRNSGARFSYHADDAVENEWVPMSAYFKDVFTRVGMRFLVEDNDNIVDDFAIRCMPAANRRKAMT